MPQRPDDIHALCSARVTPMAILSLSKAVLWVFSTFKDLTLVSSIENV